MNRGKVRQKYKTPRQVSEAPDEATDLIERTD